MPADAGQQEQALAAEKSPVPESSQNSIRLRIAAWLNHAIFLCFCLISLFAPHETQWAFITFKVAFLIWAARLVLNRKFEPQPFLIPSLLFLALAAVATLLSYAPALSRARLEWFALILLAVVVAQSIDNLRQVKILLVLLLASTTVSVARTGWQYIHGIGTELVTIAPDTNLYQLGLRSGDIVQSMNGYSTRTPQQWSTALKATQTAPTLALRIARDAPLKIFTVQVDRNDLQQWLSRPDAAVKRGRPPRAQGHFYHYIPYAGMLLQIGLLTFGLLVSSWREKIAVRWILAVLFMGTTAALLATVTRTYVAALLLGCAFTLWLAFKKIRMAALIALALGFIVGTIWIQKERNMGWFAFTDAGSEYRWLMWKDAPRQIAQHPLFGVGPDSVMQYGEQWGLAAYKKYPLRSHFHSTFIQLAVDCGLPCLAAWVWLMLAYLLFLARSWKQVLHAEWFARGAFLGIFAAAVAFVVSSFIHYTLGDGEVMVLIWLFMGLAIAMVRLLASAQPRTENS